jgi:ribonuclease HIII
MANLKFTQNEEEKMIGIIHNHTIKEARLRDYQKLAEIVIDAYKRRYERVI